MMINENIDAVSERIRAVCSGRSCREIAELTDTSGETVRRYLHGSPPSVLFVRGLCRSFHLSSDWLLFGEDPVTRDIPGEGRAEPLSDPMKVITSGHHGHNGNGSGVTNGVTAGHAVAY